MPPKTRDLCRTCKAPAPCHPCIFRRRKAKEEAQRQTQVAEQAKVASKPTAAKSKAKASSRGLSMTSPLNASATVFKPQPQPARTPTKSKKSSRNLYEALGSVGPPSTSMYGLMGNSGWAELGDDVAGADLCEEESINVTESETQRHLALINGHGPETNASQSAKQQQIYSLQTTPLFSHQVKSYVDHSLTADDTSPFQLYGMLGLRITTYSTDGTVTEEPYGEDNLVYSNTSAPWSTFICGQQGAGKSYTLSCILENALLKGNRIGRNNHPLTGLVFAYDKHSGAHSTQICEAAYLCSRGVQVDVLTLPTNIIAMQEAYNLPGIPANLQPHVKPLLFDESSLKLDYMLTLMNQSSGEKMPLYMSSITNIIRKMKINNTPFSIRAFELEISRMKFTKDQQQPLDLRMDLLKSFMWSTAKPEHRSLAKHPGIHAAPGHLTIVDLSCSTINESDVCTLYEICLSIFLAARNNSSKPPPNGNTDANPSSTEDTTNTSLIIALDEAHKFLEPTSPSAISFTDELIRLIRQQRHLRARVVIATQEPTIEPKLMDLCDVTIVHRFRSPAWFDAVRGHLAGMVWTAGIGVEGGREVFERIVGLRDG